MVVDWKCQDINGAIQCTVIILPLGKTSVVPPPPHFAHGEDSNGAWDIVLLAFHVPKCYFTL